VSDPSDPAELLSASAVARLLHLGKQEVLDMVAAGRIPTITIGRHPRVMRASLVRWLESKETGG
jgi:excisionase family DNA binding protein